MKFIFALCLVVLVAGAFAGEMTDVQKQYYLKWSKECVEETGIPMDVVHELRAGIWEHVDDKTKCFCKCTQDKANFLIGNKPNIPFLTAILPDIYGKNATDAANSVCYDVVGSDDCDTSYQLYQCYFYNGIVPKLP